jgi:hypothetical protein
MFSSGSLRTRISFISMLVLSACGADNSSNPVAKSVSEVPAVTVGGSVKGIPKGFSLTLKNNNGDMITVAADGAFSFPTPVAASDTFSITVDPQPAGQTCTVVNGSGTAGTANFSNIVVTCSASSYKVGGSITGLTSSGLVLSSGDNAVTVAPNASSFELPSPVASGSSYGVTVSSQPAGENCSVSNGTGTMADANITTVTVSCKNQPFVLGGTVSGLTSGGLVLANGIDTLAVTANSTNFSMPTTVTFGDAYSVTVQTQPAGQTCAVSQAAGTMPAGPVNSVTVVCANQAYALSGTISGLTASGLVLANGSDSLPVSTGATRFTMPATVPYASPYALTINTQPTNQICSVSNGSGTASTAAVTNVNIVCSVNTYTVGGSITGLTSTGLVLSNGSDVTPSIGANATVFTMPTGVASGSAYNIAVQSQPAGQICTVSNGSGQLSTSNVGSVTVNCTSNIVTINTLGPSTFVVPSGVTTLKVVVTGAGGGASSHTFGTGGHAGVVTSGTLSVVPGSSIPVMVGAGGAVAAGSPAAGLGGGLSSFNAGALNQVIAGGGGGQGVALDVQFGQPTPGGSGASGCAADGGGMGFSQPSGIYFVRAYGGLAGVSGTGGLGGIAALSGFVYIATVDGIAGSSTLGGDGASYEGKVWGGGGGAGFGGGGGGSALIQSIRSVQGFGGPAVTGADHSGGGGSGGCTGGTYSVANNGGIRQTGTGAGGNGSIVITLNP